MVSLVSTRRLRPARPKITRRPRSACPAVRPIVRRRQPRPAALPFPIRERDANRDRDLWYRDDSAPEPARAVRLVHKLGPDLWWLELFDGRMWEPFGIASRQSFGKTAPRWRRHETREAAERDAAKAEAQVSSRD